MNRNVFRVRFWGVRGSLPVSGQKFVRYGGNTMCVEMRCGDTVLLFDAGSGLLPAGKAMKAEGITAFNLFFSHCHYDHIIGLPYFTALFDPGANVAFWSGHLEGRTTTREMIGDFMRPPWFPVEPDTCCASLDCRDFHPGDTLNPLKDVVIKTGRLNHPGGAVGYRVEWGGKAVAMITDTEHVPGILDPAVLELIQDADLFLYDCTYTEEEMPRHVGYGHSSWQQATKLAKAANAKQVALIHHAPWRSDDDLAVIEAAAAKEFSGAFAARDGQIVDV